MTIRSTQAGSRCRAGPRGRHRSASMPPVRIAPAPAMQAGPAGTEREGCGDALLLRGTDTADAEAQRGRSSRARGLGGRPPRVARKRKPGPSWYVCRSGRRCGSERVIQRHYAPRHRHVPLTPGTTPSSRRPPHPDDVRLDRPDHIGEPVVPLPRACLQPDVAARPGGDVVDALAPKEARRRGVVNSGEAVAAAVDHGVCLGGIPEGPVRTPGSGLGYPLCRPRSYSLQPSSSRLWTCSTSPNPASAGTLVLAQSVPSAPT